VAKNEQFLKSSFQLSPYNSDL